MDPVIHFEMPYDDAERVAAFYGDVFGWRLQNLGAENNHYVLAETIETDEHRMPMRPGAINGGFYRRAPEGPQHPALVIQVEDIVASIAKVTAAGGMVHGEPLFLPGVGHYALFSDTEGNRASLLQPAEAADGM